VVPCVFPLAVEGAYVASSDETLTFQTTEVIQHEFQVKWLRQLWAVEFTLDSHSLFWQVTDLTAFYKNQLLC